LAVHIFTVFAVSFMWKNLLNSTGNPCHLEGFVVEKSLEQQYCSVWS